jgi:Holliday junction resolvase RusA-like endonuclease
MEFFTAFHTVEVSLPKPPSLNEYYAGKHWTSRKKKTDAAREAVCFLLKEKEKPDMNVKMYKIYLRSNGRTDIDNRIIAVKTLNDAMEKDLGWIPSDNPSVFKGLNIVQDDSLNKDEFIATITFFGNKQDK